MVEPNVNVTEFVDKTRRFGSYICLHFQGGEEPTQLGPLEKVNSTHWMSSDLSSLLDVFQNKGRWTRSSRCVIPYIIHIHHSQNTLDVRRKFPCWV
jgi:hypothetical protein